MVCFILLFPVEFFSVAFKCKFVLEKFDGGKTNAATCFGSPKQVMHLPDPTPALYFLLPK